MSKRHPSRRQKRASGKQARERPAAQLRGKDSTPAPRTRNAAPTPRKGRGREINFGIPEQHRPTGDPNGSGWLRRPAIKAISSLLALLLSVLLSDVGTVSHATLGRIGAVVMLTLAVGEFARTALHLYLHYWRYVPPLPRPPRWTPATSNKLSAIVVSDALLALVAAACAYVFYFSTHNDIEFGVLATLIVAIVFSSSATVRFANDAGLPRGSDRVRRCRLVVWLESQGERWEDFPGYGRTKKILEDNTRPYEVSRFVMVLVVCLCCAALVQAPVAVPDFLGAITPPGPPGNHNRTSKEAHAHKTSGGGKRSTPTATTPRIDHSTSGTTPTAAGTNLTEMHKPWKGECTAPLNRAYRQAEAQISELYTGEPPATVPNPNLFPLPPSVGALPGTLEGGCTRFFHESRTSLGRFVWSLGENPETRQILSIAVDSQRYGPALFMTPAVTAIEGLIRRFHIIGGIRRFETVSSDFYPVITPRGTFILIRRNKSAGAYRLISPVVGQAWVIAMKKEHRFLWPKLTTLDGQEIYKFYIDVAPSKLAFTFYSPDYERIEPELGESELQRDAEYP